MNAEQIVNELTRRAWRFGVSVLLDPKPAVFSDSLRVGGFFCEEEKKLVVAAGKIDWLSTLLHEYSHLTQWAEDCTVWRDDCMTDLDEWLAGKPVRNIRKQIEGRRELEADCERRAIRLAIELEAPIDLSQYARQANSYIHFHNVMLAKRKWYLPDRGPYSAPEVTALANSTFDKDFSKTPPALYAALLTCI